MKVIHIDLPSEIKDNELILMPISDTHLESKECNLKAIKKWIEEVKNTPNAYTIFLGDIFDNALKTSVSDTYSAKMSPDEAINFAVELFEPIKDRILCIIEGNHENRSKKLVGLSQTKVLAHRLGLDDKYAGEGAMLFISFGKSQGRYIRKQIVSLYAVHGFSGGRKIGGKMNGLEMLSDIVSDCDLYMVGHTHQAAIFRKSTFKSNLRNKIIVPHEKVYVNLNAWLSGDVKNYGGYAQAFGFTPPSIQYPIITVKGYDKKIEATL